MWGLISLPSSSSSAGARPAFRASSNSNCFLWSSLDLNPTGEEKKTCKNTGDEKRKQISFLHRTLNQRKGKGKQERGGWSARVLTCCGGHTVRNGEGRKETEQKRAKIGRKRARRNGRQKRRQSRRVYYASTIGRSSSLLCISFFNQLIYILKCFKTQNAKRGNAKNERNRGSALFYLIMPKLALCLVVLFLSSSSCTCIVLHKGTFQPSINLSSLCMIKNLRSFIMRDNYKPPL